MRRSREVGLALVLALMVAALAAGVVMARGSDGGVGAGWIHGGSASPVKILSDISGASGEARSVSTEGPGRTRAQREASASAAVPGRSVRAHRPSARGLYPGGRQAQPVPSVWQSREMIGRG